MPYAIRKIKNQDAYTVKNKETGKVHSHHTTKAKAKAQVRLLQSLGGMEQEQEQEQVKPLKTLAYEALTPKDRLTYLKMHRGVIEPFTAPVVDPSLYHRRMAQAYRDKNPLYVDVPRIRGTGKGGMDVEMTTPMPRPEHFASIGRQETPKMGAEDTRSQARQKQWEAVGEKGDPIVAYKYQEQATPARRTNPYEWEINEAPIVDAVLPVEDEETDVMQQLREMGINRMFLLPGRVMQAISQVLPDTFESPYTQFRNASLPEKNKIASILQGVPVGEELYAPAEYIDMPNLEEKRYSRMHYGPTEYDQLNIQEDVVLKEFYNILKYTIPDKASRVAYLKYTNPPIDDIMSLQGVPKDLIMSMIMDQFTSIPNLEERILKETNRIKRETYKRRAKRSQEERDIAIRERVQAERGREGHERASMGAEDTGAGYLGRNK